MQIYQVVVGPLATNCYLVKSEDHLQTLVVDPGGDAEAILEAVGTIEGKVVGLVCTHGHPDHTGALRRLVRETEAPVYVHPADRQMLQLTWPEFGVSETPVDAATEVRELREGDILRAGKVELRVLHTPGHSPGSVCLVGEEYVLTGDTLFAGNVGRTDLPGSSEAAMKQSLQRIKTELSPIMLVYPGHGDSSLMTQELASNPWLAEPKEAEGL